MAGEGEGKDEGEVVVHVRVAAQTFGRGSSLLLVCKLGGHEYGLLCGSVMRRAHEGEEGDEMSGEGRRTSWEEERR